MAIASLGLLVACSASDDGDGATRSADAFERAREIDYSAMNDLLLREGNQVLRAELAARPERSAAGYPMATNADRAQWTVNTLTGLWPSTPLMPAEHYQQQSLMWDVAWKGGKAAGGLLASKDPTGMASALTSFMFDVWEPHMQSLRDEKIWGTARQVVDGHLALYKTANPSGTFDLESVELRTKVIEAGIAWAEKHVGYMTPEQKDAFNFASQTLYNDSIKALKKNQTAFLARLDDTDARVAELQRSKVDRVEFQKFARDVTVAMNKGFTDLHNRIGVVESKLEVMTNAVAKELATLNQKVDQQGLVLQDLVAREKRREELARQQAELQAIESFGVGVAALVSMFDPKLGAKVEAAVRGGVALYQAVAALALASTPLGILGALGGAASAMSALSSAFGGAQASGPDPWTQKMLVQIVETLNKLYALCEQNFQKIDAKLSVMNVKLDVVLKELGELRSQMILGFARQDVNISELRRLAQLSADQADARAIALAERMTQSAQTPYKLIRAEVHQAPIRVPRPRVPGDRNGNATHMTLAQYSDYHRALGAWAEVAREPQFTGATDVALADPRSVRAALDSVRKTAADGTVVDASAVTPAPVNVLARLAVRHAGAPESLDPSRRAFADPDIWNDVTSTLLYLRLMHPAFDAQENVSPDFYRHLAEEAVRRIEVGFALQTKEGVEAAVVAAHEQMRAAMNTSIAGAVQQEIDLTYNRALPAAVSRAVREVTRNLDPVLARAPSEGDLDGAVTDSIKRGAPIVYLTPADGGKYASATGNPTRTAHRAIKLTLPDTAGSAEVTRALKAGVGWLVGTYKMNYRGAVGYALTVSFQPFEGDAIKLIETPGLAPANPADPLGPLVAANGVRIVPDRVPWTPLASPWHPYPRAPIPTLPVGVGPNAAATFDDRLSHGDAWSELVGELPGKSGPLSNECPTSDGGKVPCSRDVLPIGLSPDGVSKVQQAYAAAAKMQVERVVMDKVLPASSFAEAERGMTAYRDLLASTMASAFPTSGFAPDGVVYSALTATGVPFTGQYYVVRARDELLKQAGTAAGSGVEAVLAPLRPDTAFVAKLKEKRAAASAQLARAQLVEQQPFFLAGTDAERARWRIEARVLAGLEVDPRSWDRARMLLALAGAAPLLEAPVRARAVYTLLGDGATDDLLVAPEKAMLGAPDFCRRLVRLSGECTEAVMGAPSDLQEGRGAVRVYFVASASAPSEQPSTPPAFASALFRPDTWAAAAQSGGAPSTITRATRRAPLIDYDPAHPRTWAELTLTPPAEGGFNKADLQLETVAPFEGDLLTAKVRGTHGEVAAPIRELGTVRFLACRNLDGACGANRADRVLVAVETVLSGKGLDLAATRTWANQWRGLVAGAVRDR